MTKATDEAGMVNDCRVTHSSEEGMKGRTLIAGEGEKLARRCGHVCHGAEL